MILLMLDKDRLNRKKSVVLKNKALKVTMDLRINGYQKGLASMVYKFFDERTKRSGLKCDKKLNEKKISAEQLNKPIIKNFKRRKVYSTFKDHFGVLTWQICH